MEKHTRRYMSERFGVHQESMDLQDMMNVLAESEPGDDYGFIQTAIDSQFTGIERDYLQIKLWDKRFGRE